jgi:hypothetical protein
MDRYLAVKHSELKRKLMEYYVIVEEIAKTRINTQKLWEQRSEFLEIIILF